MKLSLNEGFEDIFDSSLIDYSNDFEKSDNNYNELLEFHNKLNYYGMPRGEKNNLNYVNIDDLSFILPIDKHEYLWNKAEIQYGSNNNIDSVELINDKLYSCYLKKYLISIDGSTFGFTLAIPKIETTYYWLNFTVKGIFGRVYKINENENSEISATIFKRNIEKLINSNVNESFSDVFDSSLIDYHEDFEKQDLEYLKNKIRNWALTDIKLNRISNGTIYPIDNFNPDLGAWARKGDYIKIDDDLNLIINGNSYNPGDEQVSYLYIYVNCSNIPQEINNFNINCDTCQLTDYDMNFPYKFNIYGDLRLCRNGFSHLPNLSNVNVYGDVNCVFCNFKTLKGCPKYIKRDLLIYGNNLTTLEDIKDVYIGRNIDGGTGATLDTKWTKDMLPNLQGKILRIKFNKKINESFNNVFDSSLIDYSEDFENQDLEYLKNQFKEHCEELFDDVFDLYDFEISRKKVDLDNLFDDLKNTKDGIIIDYKMNDKWIPEYEDILDICYGNAESRVHNLDCDNDDSEESLYYDEDCNWDPIDEDEELDESFNNVFDSSLIDYSEDFEKQDKEEIKKNFVKEYIQTLVFDEVYRGYYLWDDYSDYQSHIYNKEEEKEKVKNELYNDIYPILIEYLNNHLNETIKCDIFHNLSKNINWFFYNICNVLYQFDFRRYLNSVGYCYANSERFVIFGGIYHILKKAYNKLIEKYPEYDILYGKLNESFDNVFESSLIDYSEDFEKQDEEYQKKQEIIDWLRDTVTIYNDLTGEPMEISDGKGITLLKMTVYAPGNPEPSHYYAIDVNGDLEFDDAGVEQLPDYIKFHTCKGYFNANGVTFKSLKGFPSQINGDFRICDSAIKSFKDGPELVGQDLHCKNNPQLKGYKALNGFPKVNGDIFADPKLEKYIYSDAYGGNDGWY